MANVKLLRMLFTAQETGQASIHSICTKPSTPSCLLTGTCSQRLPTIILPLPLLATLLTSCFMWFPANTPAGWGCMSHDQPLLVQGSTAPAELTSRNSSSTVSARGARQGIASCTALWTSLKLPEASIATRLGCQPSPGVFNPVKFHGVTGSSP